MNTLFTKAALLSFLAYAAASDDIPSLSALQRERRLPTTSTGGSPPSKMASPPSKSGSVPTSDRSPTTTTGKYSSPAGKGTTSKMSSPTSDRAPGPTGKYSSGKGTGKYSSPTSNRNPPSCTGGTCALTAVCTDLQICTNEIITPFEIGYLSYDTDGSLPSLMLAKTMGFAVGTTDVVLKATGKSGGVDYCKASITAVNCDVCSGPTNPKNPTPTSPRSPPPVMPPSKAGKGTLPSPPSKSGPTSPRSPPTTPSKSAPSKSGPTSNRNPTPTVSGKGKGTDTVSPPSKSSTGGKGKIRERWLQSKGGTTTTTTSTGPSKSSTPTGKGKGTDSSPTAPRSPESPSKSSPSKYSTPTGPRSPASSPSKSSPSKSGTPSGPRSPASSPSKSSPSKSGTPSGPRSPASSPSKSGTPSKSSTPAGPRSPSGKSCIVPPQAKCKDPTVCAGGKITVDDVDNGSFDPNGDMPELSLDDYGPFKLSDNGQVVTLTIIDEDNFYDTCTATVTVTTCGTNKPPKAVCTNLTVCTGQTITPNQVGAGSLPGSGFIKRVQLSNTGPFSVGVTKVVLTVENSKNLTATCDAFITTRACTPAPAPKTPAPQKKITPAPQKKITPAPQKKITPAPQKKITPAPQKKKTPAPQQKRTPGPQKKITPAPQLSNVPRPTPPPQPTSCASKIFRFDLIDALHNTVLFKLPSIINYPALYLRYFNIQAVPQGCPGKRIRSVLWIRFDGRVVCDSSAPFSLFGETDGVFNSFIFPLGGPYNITAIPYTTKDCSGVPGQSLSQQLFAVGPKGYNQCPGAPCYFDLYNADTHEYVQAIKQGQKICLPNYKVNFKASVINCDGGRVRSVKFAVGGDRTYTSIDEGTFFYVYGDEGAETYSPGKYSLTATSYAAKGALGDPASTYTVSFEFIQC